MNKKLIAAAVAAGLVAPMAAQAEITPYAHVQFEIANIDDGTDSETVVTDQSRGRVGLKGSHDLGGGMTAFAKAEFDIDGGNRDSEFGDSTLTDTAGNEYTTRNGLRIRQVYAGVKGGFGSLEIGTISSAYKYTGGVKYDPFLTTTLEARGNGGMTGTTMGHNGFVNNAVGYKNDFGMASLWITYSPDETDVGDGSGTTDGQGDDGQYTAALKVSQANWEAFVSMVDNGNSDATAEYDSTKVGGQYRMGPHTISAQYEMSSEGTGANTDTDTMFLGYQMSMGKNTFVAQIGQTDEDGVAEKEDYMAIGAIHKLNKKARVFVGYRDTDQGAVSEESSLSVGLRVDI